MISFYRGPTGRETHMDHNPALRAGLSYRGPLGRFRINFRNVAALDSGNFCFAPT